LTAANRRGGDLEVVPGTITPVFDRLREASRAFSSVAWQVSAHLPLMPPAFYLATREAVIGLTVTLQWLALDLEAMVAVEGLRLARIEGAASAVIGTPLAGDLVEEAQDAWSQLSATRGLDVVTTPMAQEVHSINGGAEEIASLWHTTAVLLQAGPVYGLVDAPGERRARHELVSMGINMTRLLPAWGLLDRDDHVQAWSDLGSRALDVKDLEEGDFMRWGGHMGLGLVLGKGADALVGESLEGASAGAGAGWRAAPGGGYKAVSDLNPVPVSRPQKSRNPLARRVTEAEEQVGEFLERAVP
jgi:hypothetical protein